MSPKNVIINPMKKISPLGEAVFEIAIFCDGRALDPAIELILARFVSEIEGGTSLLLKFNMPIDVGQLDDKVAHLFAGRPGRPRQVSAKLGWNDDLTAVFDGHVVRNRVIVAENGTATLEVSAKADKILPEDQDVQIQASFGDNVIAAEIDDLDQTGSVRMPGCLEAVPGAQVKLSGFGRIIDDEYRISGVEHELSGGVWESRLTFDR